MKNLDQCREFAALYEKAHQAGLAAGNKSTPVPMVVQEAELDGSATPGGKSWYVADGVCGFAWVKVPGNKPFGRWLKSRGLASSAYGGGLQIWVSQFNQSMQRKEAYAAAFADTLEQSALAEFIGPVYSQSRMD